MVFYGGVYQYGSLNGSLGILAKGLRGGYSIMVTENFVNYGRPTLGSYIAINPILEQNRKYLGMKEAVKKMFCEDEKSYLDMRNWHRTLFKLKPEFEKRIRDEDLKGGKEK